MTNLPTVSTPPRTKLILATPPAETAKTAWQILRQPMTLAVLGSIGVHGLLWAVLPLFSNPETPPTELPKPVRLVELSPLEQAARLPNAALLTPPPPSSLGKASNPFLLPNTSNPLSDLDSLYRIPTLPPPSGAPLPPIIDTSELFRNSPSEDRPAPPGNKPAPKKDDRVGIQQAPEDLFKPNQPPSQPGDGTAPDNQTPDPRNPRRLPDPSNPPTPPDPPTEAERQAELAARREQRRKEYQQDYTATPYADDRAKLKDYSAGSDKLTEDAAKNYGEQLEDSWFKKLEKITGTYPEEACLFKEVEGQAIVGAVVRSDGKVMGDAIVLQSSGYKGLDQAAVKQIEARTFTAEELGEFKEGKLYRMVQVPISFEPSEAECKEDPVQPIS